ncbi:hypothetical protein [Fulvimonas yonginensis]|uniref:Uncharacterized protein n=1 Tax=Fulvimonas yonginensis TaxID=1495200 RepID=A0ABU8JAV9_9GAMM
MDRSAFDTSLAGSEPPAGLPVHLQALWWLRRGEADRAHRLVQALDDAGAAAIHAHLHRLEGDADNAGYWYRRAGLPFCDVPPEDEWRALVQRFM